MAYVGWELDVVSRNTLLSLFTPAYPDVIAHHITHKFGTNDPNDIPRDSVIRVVGFADDTMGVQALVVEVNGTTQRPDGEIYHITWSIDREAGRKPSDSKAVVAAGWTKTAVAVNIQTTPKLF